MDGDRPRRRVARAAGVAVVEKPRWCGSAAQPARHRSRRHAVLLIIRLAEMRHRLPNDA